MFSLSVSPKQQELYRRIGMTKGRQFMRCGKCGGLMFYEKFISEEIEDFSGWRCVICGDIVDEVILKNRARR